jgi:glycosyltransferase involved in cell wall biosynthesis
MPLLTSLTGVSSHQVLERATDSPVRSVLLVTRRWTRDGGVGAHAIASATALAESGIEVSVLAARVGEEPSVPGITLQRRPALFDFAAPTHERLGELPAADVVHVHQVDHPEIVRALRDHAPVVLSAHGYTACTTGMYYFRPGQECTRAHGPGCVPNLAVRGCAHTWRVQTLPGAYRQTTRERQALEQADMAVSYSSAVDRHLARNGLERRRIVPLFSTTPAYLGSGHESRRRVLFAGRLAAPKGVEVLIQAAADVDCELVICGEGWRLEAARKLAQRLGIAGRVRFTGWLDADALAREIAEASVVALPSLWPEPFGLVGIEALAAGRPVVASATGGVADWLDHGRSGLLVEPGDAAALAGALNELLDDPERQRTMGEAGRDSVARHFSAASHIAALLDCYRDARAGWLAQRSGGDGVAPAVQPPISAHD